MLIEYIFRCHLTIWSIDQYKLLQSSNPSYKYRQLRTYTHIFRKLWSMHGFQIQNLHERWNLKRHFVCECICHVCHIWSHSVVTLIFISVWTNNFVIAFELFLIVTIVIFPYNISVGLRLFEFNVQLDEGDLSTTFNIH